MDSSQKTKVALALVGVVAGLGTLALTIGGQVNLALPFGTVSVTCGGVLSAMAKAGKIG